MASNGSTTVDDKDTGSVKLLPASDLAAIYDTHTHILYLYAKGTYVTPALTSFVRLPWVGGVKFAFQGYYTKADEADSKPTVHQFADEHHLNLAPSLKGVIILTADSKPITTSVEILRVPRLLE